MKRVRVNRQSCRKGDGWDICNLQQEKIGWAQNIKLTNCEFYVDQVVRIEAIKTGKRLLHAWVEASWNEEEFYTSTRNMRRINYKPQLYPFFYYEDTQDPINKVNVLYLDRTGMYTD